MWSCGFEVGSRESLCEFDQLEDDKFDWTITSRSTDSDDTGPSKAYEGNYYAYIEASSPRELDDDAV